MIYPVQSQKFQQPFYQNRLNVGHEFQCDRKEDKKRLPSHDFLDIPNVGGSRLHPRQLLHSDSGSLLKLHRESSSKRSESSKEKRSFSSHSIRCPPPDPASSAPILLGSAAAPAAPAFLEAAVLPSPPPLLLASPPPLAPTPAPPPLPLAPAAPPLPLPPASPFLPPVRPPAPPPPPPLPEDRARLPASFNCRANHTRNYERVLDGGYLPPCSPRRVSSARSRGDADSTTAYPETCDREKTTFQINYSFIVPLRYQYRRSHVHAQRSLNYTRSLRKITLIASLQKMFC